MYKMPSAASGVATKVINSGPGKAVDKQTTDLTGKVGIHTAPGDVAKAELNGGMFGGAKAVGGDIANAYHTSIVDPVKKAAEHLKALAGGASFNLVGLTLEVGVKSTTNKLSGGQRIGSL